jgi:Rrf2 family iron-sulfur cluster assembly transcriptional regulator
MRLALTRRGDYAVRAMLALGRAGGARLSTPVMAASMNIPIRFLPQVMGDLARAGLVRSKAGRQGGYELARPPDEISLLTIIEAVEGDTRRRTCILRGGPCQRDAVCEVHRVFGSAQDALLGQLAAVSLGSLAPVFRSADAGSPS